MFPLLLLACANGPDGKALPPGDTSTDTSDTSDTSHSGDTSDTSHSGDTSDTSHSGDTGPWVRPERPDVDHPPENASWRWGGGDGYPDVVEADWPILTRVGSLEELAAALAEAVEGDVVWVEGDAEIDLTGQSLCIPGGVWLAGDRGQAGAPGALLYATEGASTPVLRACGEDVRITGLRIRGPDPETCPAEWPDRCPEDVSGDPNCAYCTTTAYGIGTDGNARLEVDNNELSGWTYAAVGVKNALDADVHHNHIHHGWREGLGYGVVLYGTGETTATIRWNRFDAMRHVVAGQGYGYTDYEARDNLMGENAISHVYDMHGQDEAADDGSPNAGRHIEVYRNIVLVPDQYSFVVRGRPTDGSWLYDNCLAPREADAYDQRYYTGNFHVDEDPSGASAPNTYGADAGDCGTLHWCLVDAVVGALRYGSASGTPAADLLVGDLDGDGRDDVFGSDGSRWRWANPDGGSWASLASSGVGTASLALVDLDGDGVDDVFYANGSSWQWSRSGTASWATLKSATQTLSELGFGDFDGDGAQDVFTTDGSRWSYHPRGSGAPVLLASSGVSITDLACGDFDGDGVSDVFYADGAQWWWSRSGAASWAALATSGNRVADLRFADVDGDRVTDVLGRSGSTLRWSAGGRRSWAVLRHEIEGFEDLRLGDFDGDGRVDLLVGGCL